MLNLQIKEREAFRQSDNRFITLPSVNLKLEHSLASISMWESRWHIPFLDTTQEKTNKQIVDYVFCMCLDENVPSYVFSSLTKSEYDQINKYLDDTLTATIINEYDNTENNSKSNRKITSEVIYSWMVDLNIPFECDKWPLNRLLTLIRVCRINEESKNGKNKMSHEDILAQNAALNASRKLKAHSHG